MSRRCSRGSATAPSTQIVKATSSRVVVKMARLASLDVSLTARLKATAPLKPEGRNTSSEQTAGVMTSIKPNKNFATNYMSEETESNPLKSSVLE